MPNVGDMMLIPAPSLANDETMSAIGRARASMFATTAEGSALSTVGQNYGVSRPPMLTNDEMYRRLIQVLAWQPKTVLFAVYNLLAVVLGSQASLIAQALRPWRVYEANANEIIIELPTSLVEQSNSTASYMHGWYGYAHVPAGPSATFTTSGDVTSASAITTAGMDLYVYIVGAWVAYTVVSATYNSITDLTTVVVSAATVPSGGGAFYLDVPGDGVASFGGDFIAASTFISTFSTAGGPTDTIEVLGDATIDLNVDHDVTLVYAGALHTFTIFSLTYNLTTHTTTIVMTAATIPGGLVRETIVREIDVSDTATTPTHDDRVYLSALGAYEIVAYYLDLLVRASGIVVRLEQV